MPGMMKHQISQISITYGFLDLFEYKEHAWNDENFSKYLNFTIFRHPPPRKNFQFWTNLKIP